MTHLTWSLLWWPNDYFKLERNLLPHTETSFRLFFGKNPLHISFPLIYITFSVHLRGEGRRQFLFEALLTKKKRLNPYDIARLTFDVRENLSFRYCNKKAWSVSRFLAQHITLVNLKIQSQSQQKRESRLLLNRLEKCFSGPKCSSTFWETQALNVLLSFEKSFRELWEKKVWNLFLVNLDLDS